jgi:hypothetical protein
VAKERANRYIREAFIAEACHVGIDSWDELNDRFVAWAEQVANRRRHAETNETPIGRFERGGPPRQADPAQLREAFRWSVTRKVTRTATVPWRATPTPSTPPWWAGASSCATTPKTSAVSTSGWTATPPGWPHRS